MSTASYTAFEYSCMARALQLARKGIRTTRPNPRVGCVLARDGRIVGEGWHERAGEDHAEIRALKAAGDAARGATVFVTLEPCSHHGRTPPCADALVAAGVAHMVVAMEDPNPLVAGRGLYLLQQAGIGMRVGLLREQAEALNAGFISRMRRQRPWLRIKLAASLDGRTAMASGESRWITGADARRDVHRQRAASCAILTGINTVLADDPGLNVRDLERPGSVPPPLRVVLDSGLKMPVNAAMLRLPGKTLVITTARAPAAREQALLEAGAEVVRVDGDRRPDLAASLTLLAGREINDVLLEAGPVLSGALLQAGLADELLLYQSLHFMGHGARPLLQLPGLEAMEQRLELDLTDVRRFGRDFRFTVRPRSGGGHEAGADIKSVVAGAAGDDGYHQ